MTFSNSACRRVSAILEQALATSLGVSRTPLRFALHVLANEGYLNRIDGHSSWQVKPLDLAYYEDLYDFRMSIEVLAIQRLCKMDSRPELSSLGAFWRVPKAPAGHGWGHGRPRG